MIRMMVGAMNGPIMVAIEIYAKMTDENSVATMLITIMRIFINFKIPFYLVF